MRRGAEKPCAKYLPAMQVAQGFSSRHAITQRFVRRNDILFEVFKGALRH